MFYKKSVFKYLNNICVMIVFIFILPQIGLASENPILLFASAKAGTNSNWPGDSTKGAAITVWGRNLGAYRGTSTLTVCGVNLNSDQDFVEWGAKTNPKTVKDISRITFHLTSSMSGSGGIMVSVNGKDSNILPFQISSIGDIYIYPTDKEKYGWNDLDDACDDMKPGDFLYIRSGTYDEKWYIGYLTSVIDGTDANRITMMSYPGEMAIIAGGYIRVHSSYWTFTNLSFNNTALFFGAQVDFCVGAIPRNGLAAIGNSLTGQADEVIRLFGHNVKVLGNYANVVPKDDTSYPFYLSSGRNVIIAYNEIHGGSRWCIHLFDEDRPSCDDVDRVVENWVIENNILDSADVGQGYRGSLIIQATSIARFSNISVRNNILYSSGAVPSECLIRIRHYVDGVNIEHNTFYNGPVGVKVTDSLPDNVVVKNNIFSNISGYDAQNDGDAGDLVLNNNLYDSTPSLKNTSDSNALIGNPDFVDANNSDFHLKSSSWAIDSGAE